MKIGLIYGGIGIEESYSKRTLEEIVRIFEFYELEYCAIYLNGSIDWEIINSCDLFFVVDSNILDYFKKFSLFKYIYDNNFDFIGQRDEISRILRDKCYTNFLLRSNGIDAPRSFISNDKKVLVNDYPVIVKDNYGSSSKDVYICDDYNDVKTRIKTILTKGRIPLCENYIEGREFTCAYIKICGVDLILDPLEIKYEGRIYNFETKNLNLGDEIIVYPKLSKVLSKRINNTIKKVNKILNTQYYSRTDFKIIDNNIIIIEVNGEPVLASDDFIASSFYKLNFKYDDFILGLLSNSNSFINYIKKHKKELYKYINNLKQKVVQANLTLENEYKAKEL